MTSGSRAADAIPAYPDDSLQGSIGGPWWEEVGGKDLRRGRLVWVFIPHVDQEPRQLDLVARTSATEHGAAQYIIAPLRIGQRRTGPPLPVAAMPLASGEVHTVYRAKVRPALVLSAPMPEIPADLRRGAAKWPTAPTVLVAPYYGADQDGTRGGWRPEFVERIRRCEYPQYLWDKLPLGGSSESILRFDHVQPVGLHSNACDVTPYALSADGLGVLDDWLLWITTGLLVEDGLLALIRADLMARPVDAAPTP